MVMGWVPLTPMGLCLTVAAATAWLQLGQARGDLVVRTLASTALAVYALAAMSSLVAALVLKRNLSARERTATPLELEVGHAGPTGFAAQVTALLPLVDAQVQWVHPAVDQRLARVRGALEERVTPRRRGEFDRIERSVTVSDHLGLCRVRFQATELRAVRFFPSVGALKNIQVVQGMTGGDGLAHPEGPPAGDPMDIRHYGEGDPIRYVLWKVFAKSRTLVVRTPERAISPQERTVAYLVSAPHDQASAGAARIAVETRALGGRWQVGADGSREVAVDRSHAMRLILDSARASSEESGAGLGPFLATLDGPARRALVFVPPVPGPWLDRVLACAASGSQGGSQLEFVVCVDGIAPASTDSRWWQRRHQDLKGADPRALGEVLRRLSGAGRLSVLDRQTGVYHPESHLGALTRRAS